MENGPQKVETCWKKRCKEGDGIDKKHNFVFHTGTKNCIIFTYGEIILALCEYYKSYILRIYIINETI